MREHLATLLEDFRRYDKEIAVVRHQGVRRRVTTYGELARLAGRFAAFLEKRGIGPGDRVVLWAENGAEWMAAFYGCMLRGVLTVPLDAYGTIEFAARVCTDVKPKLVVGDGLLLHQLSEEWPRLEFAEWPSALPQNEAGPVAGLSGETPLQILFTSGTTGDPKGVVITHGNVLASVMPIEDGATPYMRYEPLVHPLRILHTLPLSHVFGQTMGLWVPPILKAEVHFESRLVAPRLIETIREERISVLAAVPRVFAVLKNHLETSRPGLAEAVAGSEGIRAWERWWRFRAIHRAFGMKFWALVSGGGALTAQVEGFWNKLGFVVIQGYGMTETTALITLNHPFHVARGSIGKPMPGREVKLGPDGEVLVRGPMISTATWSDGAVKQREDEWLATGDLAETQPGGELHFKGRKSEVIVTAAGVNLHPEDLESAIEQEPGVEACVVVPMETPAGPEACAVLAMRGAEDRAAAAIAQANSRLAEFQRLRRWILWPEPDLPRTSTGKVRRKAVAQWLAGVQAAAAKPWTREGGTNGKGANADWLLALIAQITGETPHGVGDELRLTEDLHLDSLGRVQLASELEERLSIDTQGGLLDRVTTLGELRALVAGEPVAAPVYEPELEENAGGATAEAQQENTPEPKISEAAEEHIRAEKPVPAREGHRYLYPRWPWRFPFPWIRTAFLEVVAHPLVWFLANPRVTGEVPPTDGEPLLIIANHVTAYDGPLVEYALPKALRRRIAVAMSGEMLDRYLHFRNPGAAPGSWNPVGPVFYGLLTALFNVFPLAAQRNFQTSFVHAGKAMDRGYNVLVFPEGTRSATGELAQFRPGIGVLARQSGAAVLPVGIRGLGELKQGKRRWFRSGTIEVRVGRPVRFAPEESEAEITERLREEVAKLLKDS